MERQAETGAVDPALGELFSNNCVEPKVFAPATTVLLGNSETDESVLAGSGVQLPVHDSGGFPVVVLRDHLRIDEGSEALPEQFVRLVIDRRHTLSLT